MTRLQQGIELQKAGQLDQAAAIYAEVLMANPQNANAIQLLGLVSLQKKEYDRAVELISTALKINPNAAPFHHNIGAALRVLGDFEKAEQHYQRAIELQPDYAEAYFNLSAVRKFSTETSLHETIETHLLRDDVSTEDRCFFHFAAGKMYDDLKRFEEAFQHYQKGNQSQGAVFDREQYGSLVDNMISVCNRDLLQRHQGQGFPSEAPVFIVGMPRSGTTLLEQILASHPQANGAGELPDIMSIAHTMPQHSPQKLPYPLCLGELSSFVFRGFGDAYVKRLRSLDHDASRVVDKLPRNFENVGLITMMLPQAKIIHIHRDPLDTCLSCYFQRFRTGQEWSYHFADLAFYYRCYRRLMEHWRSSSPSPIFEVRYEALVENQEEESRRIIEFCGLPWDERCLQFHQTKRAVSTASNWQVRRPVYRSAVQRWKNYESQIQPLAALLKSGSPQH